MLCGRDPERARIGELLDGARRSHSGVLVLRGEPGVGKSALLALARDEVPGMRVLSSEGIESETELPFAALHQLVRPILGDLDVLPAPQAGALRSALGLTASAGADRFLVSLAVLSLLAEAAERQPVLCLVDDAQWLDDASTDALVFAARRLEAEGIAMLFAAREGELRRFEAPGLPSLQLGGLDPASAGQLLDQSVGGSLPAGVRDRLIDETGGSPLALVELSTALSAAQLSGEEPLPSPLPISTGVERAYLARVRQLPEPTQAVLLVAATDDTGALTTVLPAAAQLGVASEALDAAEESGLLRVREGRIEFRHPLVRSALYHSAPLSRRQAVHRALAETLDGPAEADRRAWHRAAASIEPDPSVVDELRAAADRARRRSGFGTASVALERAAALASRDDERARLLIAAGEDAWLAGQGARARLLLERARRLTEEPIERADIERSLGLIELTHGVPADACRLLLGAARSVAQLDDERALDLLNLASLGATFAGEREALIAIARLAASLAVEDNFGYHTIQQLLVGLGAHVEGDFANAAPMLRAALALDQPPSQAARLAPSVSLVSAERATIFLGDDQANLESGYAAASAARADGLLGRLTLILPRLGYGELWAGHWESASANAREGLQLARDLDQPLLIAHQLVLLALIAAHRGEEDECRALAREGTELASAAGVTLVADLASWALALLELGLGRVDDAYHRAGEISTNVVVCWAGLDRIEAAIRAGERATAREWLSTFEAWAEGCEVGWARAVSSHCRGLLCEEDDETEGFFKEAVARHAEASRPFEGARTRLAYGEFLRRTRRRVDAREHLAAAHDAFETLNASVWAERARVELRASGRTARRREPSTRDQLTSQESQIAGFVAEGLSTREVAARLFLSPRTIEFHLRNVYRKLDLTSRAQLAALELDALGPRG